MILENIPTSTLWQIITIIFFPIATGIWTRLKSSINADFNIDLAWSRNNKIILDTIEKTPSESFANKSALNAISLSLILSSADAIYKSSRPQSSLPDWFCVVVFGFFGALAGSFLPTPLNITMAILLTAVALIFEISALLRSELNKQFRKFIRFCLVANEHSKVLTENPEISYHIFEREARRSAYRTSPLISKNYSKCPWFWKIIKRARVIFNKRFIFRVPEKRYGIILKYIKIRQQDIYKNF